MPKGRKKSIHPGRQCGPCKLCQQTAYNYCHLKTWEKRTQDKLRKICPDVNEDDCMCRRCEKDIKRNIDKENYTPKWVQNICSAKCIVVGCTNNQSIIHSQLYTASKVAEILACEVDMENSSLLTSLCEVHYKQIHRKGNSIHKKCYLCHCLIHGKARHCTNPTLIINYYKVNGNMDINITDTDLICSACYNHYLNLVHQEQLISRDDELMELLEGTPAPDINNHAISVALKDVIKQLGHILMQQLGVLLPELYRLFISLALQHGGDKIVASQVTEQLPKVAFLGYITSYFGKHLMWECKQRSCGILLYRRGADLALALSKTLKLLQTTSMSFLKKAVPLANPQPHQQSANPERDLKDMEDDMELTMFISKLNERIHKQIEVITSKDALSPYDISSFNVDDCIKSIDPVLWKMIVLLTRSLTESRRNTAPDRISHRRKIRCLYTLCVMLFNTNRCCSIPMHVLLTDLVEAQGGSIELIRTLNRVGAIASADTHQRYAQFFIEKKLEAGLLSELDKDIFTVVSVDNIDFLQRHAFVYCGDQKRSWHGTTVQATQPLIDVETVTHTNNSGYETPLPSTSTLHTTSTSPNTAKDQFEVPGHETSSKTPESSPTTKSPPYKKVRRRSRTSTENNSTHHYIPNSPELDSEGFITPTDHPLDKISHNHYSALNNKSLSDFHVLTTEEKALSKFKTASFFYMMLTSQKLIENLSFLSYLEKIFPHSPTPSKYVYLNVLDQNADSQETIKDVISRLYKEFHIGEKIHHLLVAGDAKTFFHLQKLKLEFGEKLSWLVPFPGDLHVLMNLQPILQKIYFDAGLRQIASACGYRGETLTSLQHCSHFKKTHHFLMQAWEAIYSLMVEIFVSTNSTVSELVGEVKELIAKESWPTVLEEYEEKLQVVEGEFLAFVQAKGREDPNWKFWEGFVSANCFAYVALYSAIRSGNWSLRIGSIKLMAPLFCAFDRTSYRCIIPQHLADCLLLPQSIEEKLTAGGFSMSIKCIPWKSIGLDEAHEMLINKDCKMAVVHPNKEFVKRMAMYFPFRSKVMHNFKTQINQVKKKKIALLDDLHFNSRDKKMMENVQVMKDAVSESKTIPSDTTKGPFKLRNAFTSTPATTLQQQDLLTFRDIGEQHLHAHIEMVYLNKKGKKKLKFHKLKTFSTPTKITKRNYSKLQKEKDHVTKCLKRRLLNHDHEHISDEQYLELPRALSDPDGIPHKGTKSSTTSFYLSQYGEDVIRSTFPPNWMPETVILEGMFLINTTPLRIHKSMQEYAKFLLDKYTSIYLNACVQEIHIVFDDPGRLKCHPKEIERERRDGNGKGPHNHCTFKDDTKIPSNWRDLVDCRECKRKLIAYLGDCFLLFAPALLKGDQKMVIAGVYDDMDRDYAWSITSSGIECSEASMKCNAEESDTRIWLHVKHSTGGNKLVFSPDTDVYHIGLTSADLNANYVVIQINPIGHQLKLLSLNCLSTAIEGDSDLQGIPIEKRKETLQVLYAATGSDFTSFFAGISKVAFLKAFYKYAQFISSSTPNIPGSLSDIIPEGDGFLAFIRLVGVAYFIKNHSAFQCSTPTAHFDLFQDESNGNAKSQHQLWYRSIRSKVWERIIYEDYLPPTIEALKLHWLRTIWVIDYWRQATNNNIHLLPVEWFGWRLEGSKVLVEWDSEENLQCIKDRVAFLMHGCGCKTGCKTGRCKCYKAGRPCGPGCNCSNCQNSNKGILTVNAAAQTCLIRLVSWSQILYQTSWKKGLT